MKNSKINLEYLKRLNVVLKKFELKRQITLSRINSLRDDLLVCDDDDIRLDLQTSLDKAYIALHFQNDMIQTFVDEFKKLDFCCV